MTVLKLFGEILAELFGLRLHRLDLFLHVAQFLEVGQGGVEIFQETIGLVRGERGDGFVQLRQRHASFGGLLGQGRKRGGKFLAFGVRAFAGLVRHRLCGFLKFLQVFLKLVHRVRIVRLGTELFLQRLHLLLQTGGGLGFSARGARGLFELFQRGILGEIPQLVLELVAGTGEVFEGFTSRERQFFEFLAEFGNGFQGFFGRFERGRALLDVAPGQVGHLFARFLDDLRVGLLLRKRLATVFRNEAKPGREREDQQCPAGHFRQTEWHQFAWINFIRVADGVVHDQVTPGAGVFVTGKFQGGTHAFLEILFHVHPASGFGETWFAPTAKDETGQRAGECDEPGPEQSGARNGREFENPEGEEMEDGTDEQSAPQSAQGALPAPAAGRAFERVLDDLEFAHNSWLSLTAMFTM